MEANHVTAERGWIWVKQGWMLFTKSPALWLALLLVALGAMLLLSFIPVVGQPLQTLLGPIMTIGFMSGCRALEQDEELEFAHLFSGFQHRTTQLVTVGGLTLLGQYLILGLMAGLGASPLIEIFASGTQPQDPQVILEAFANAGFALMVGFVLFCLLVMAIQFAPMLVYFNGLSPFEAMKLSLSAFFRNIGAIFVFGLVLSLLGIVASIPLFLGWIVLIPVIITSTYACFRDIFPFPDEAIAESNAAPDMGA